MIDKVMKTQGCNIGHFFTCLVSKNNYILLGSRRGHLGHQFGSKISTNRSWRLCLLFHFCAVFIFHAHAQRIVSAITSRQLLLLLLLLTFSELWSLSGWDREKLYDKILFFITHIVADDDDPTITKLKVFIITRQHHASVTSPSHHLFDPCESPESWKKSCKLTFVLEESSTNRWCSLVTVHTTFS